MIAPLVKQDSMMLTVLLSSVLHRTFAFMSTTIPKQKETVIPFPYSGDYRIDVLLFSLDVRWNVNQDLGIATKVTYSFMSLAPSYADAEDQSGFQTFSDEQKQRLGKSLN